MTRKVPFSADEFYHLYNRGANKMEIFLDYHDRERFLKLLYIANNPNLGKYTDIETIPGRTWSLGKQEGSLVSIGAYCLMPNHFHILIKAKDATGASLFLQKLLTGYSTYFNKKYDHSGVVFQGKTKSEHVAEDRYLRYLYSYIHLNPVKLIEPEWKTKQLISSEILKYLDNYTYSSYNDYNGAHREQSIILNKEAFPDYFMTSSGHLNELLSWLHFYEKTS